MRFFVCVEKTFLSVNMSNSNFVSNSGNTSHQYEALGSDGGLVPKHLYSFRPERNTRVRVLDSEYFHTWKYLPVVPEPRTPTQSSETPMSMFPVADTHPETRRPQVDSPTNPVADYLTYTRMWQDPKLKYIQQQRQKL